MRHDIFFKGLRQGQSSQNASGSNSQKNTDNGLNVLGYQNVRSAPIHPKVRQELDYLDREVRIIMSRVHNLQIIKLDSKNTIVQLITMEDGTRCAVLTGYQKGAISCDWK